MALSSYSGYFSLGFFYIHTSLLEPHPTQRPLSPSHVQALKEDFGKRGIFRTDNPGVVIGLGQGWNSLRNTGPEVYTINQSCPHLHLLSRSDSGPIGQIIRGNHRTEAVHHHAQTTFQPGESYWYYNVLVPGLFIFLIN